MMITVGVGETVHHGICLSIKSQNPDEVIFLLTKESKEKTLQKILESPVMTERKYREFLIECPDDFEKVVKQVDILLQNLDPKDTVIDFTAGTKAMSAGATIAGINARVGTLVYVSGERNSQGTVISGTERPVSIEPNRVYTDMLFERAIEFFNKYQYEACKKTIIEISGLTAEPTVQSKSDVLNQLAEAYKQWDRFSLNDAFKILKDIKNENLLKVWEISSQVERNKTVLSREIDNIFCIERISDLLENARRRASEDKYDDAVARLYRAIEYLGQFRLNELGLYKKDIKENAEPKDLNIEKLDINLQKKYEACRESKTGKLKLGLFKTYELLDDLKDPLGQKFREDYDLKESRVKRLMGMRNDSILAHGFVPIQEKAYYEILSLVEEFARLLVPDLDGLRKKVRFPKIKVKR